MEITYYIENAILVICLVGELDEHASSSARRQLDAIIADCKAKSIILDMSRLSFMDSTGIGVLLGRYKVASSRQIPLYVFSPSRTVDKILTMSGIYTLIPKVSTRRSQ